MRNLLLLLGTASCLALGEGMPAAGAAVAGTAKPSGEVPDLDFGDDFPATAMPDRPARPGAPASAQVPAPAPAAGRGSRAWIYWTLGLSAAAGGAAWLAHDYLGEAASPRRSTDLFTDDAP